MLFRNLIRCDFLKAFKICVNASYCMSVSFSATLFAVPLNIFTIVLCVLSGLAIFASYVGCDPMATNAIAGIDGIVPYFVRNELTFIPGMMGLFTACVFSASLR